MRTAMLATLLLATPLTARAAAFVFVPSVNNGVVTGPVEIGETVRFDTYLAVDPDEPILGVQLELEFGDVLGPVAQIIEPSVSRIQAPWTLITRIGVGNPPPGVPIERGDVLFTLTYDRNSPVFFGRPLTLALAQDLWGHLPDWDDLGGTALYMGAFAAPAIAAGPVDFELVWSVVCSGTGPSEPCENFDYALGDVISTAVVIGEDPAAGVVLPEPATAMLLALGLAAVVMRRRH